MLRSAARLCNRLGIQAESYTLANIEALSRRLLHSCGDCKFFHLVVLGDRQSFYPSSMIFHAPYGGWRRFYDLFKTRRFQIAEVIAFGDGAVLRFADGPADIKEVVLRGSNPLMLRLNGVDLEIVHFQFPPLTVSPLKDTAGELRRLTVFARASTARQDAKREAGLQLLKLLDHEIGTEEIIVNIRDDVWFVNVPGYPAFQPFVMDHEPPTAEEFQSRPQMVCAKTGSRVWCSE